MGGRLTAASPISLIEAAYTAVPSETSWLESLTTAGAGYDLGRGVVAWTVDLASAPSVRSIAARGAAESLIDPIRAFVGALTPGIARGIFAPTEFVGNASWRIARIAGEQARRAFPVPLWVLIGGDGLTSAVALAFQGHPDDFAPDLAFPHEHRRLLGLVAAHFGSASRLRAALPPASDQAETEAVLDPSGRILDARGPGKTKRGRASLAEAVVRAERARGALRSTDAAGAAELWQALVAGRWSIVETVERDGKRLLLARANPLGAPDRSALTRDEGDVVWLAAFGHTDQFIAYELGITVSTVVRRLQAAMLKMGVATRHELLRKLGR
jgi:DNA-binding CsgD family transcriptional regulator